MKSLPDDNEQISMTDSALLFFFLFQRRMRAGIKARLGVCC